MFISMPDFAVLLMCLHFVWFALIRYSENIVMDPGTVDIYPSSRIPKNLHHLVKPIYQSGPLITKDLLGSKGTFNERGFRITTDPRTLDSVLQLSSDDEVNSIQ
jgi:intermediate peptidase